jgi:hypothetical protein
MSLNSLQDNNSMTDAVNLPLDISVWQCVVVCMYFAMVAQMLEPEALF